MSESIFYIEEQPIWIKRHPRRKRLALRVRSGCVEVLAPVGLSLQRVQQFALKHRSWWLKALTKQPPIMDSPLLRADQDERWPILGEHYPLHICAESQQVRCDKGQFVCPDAASETLRRHRLLQWYVMQAETYLAQRTQHFADVVGRYPQSIQIKTYRARWGSCDSQARIQYNWKLMCLPPWVVDYVVVHELCHLTYMNHSPAFWALVEQHYPQTAQAKAWLKQHGHRVIQSF